MGKEAGEKILYGADFEALLLTDAANMQFISGFSGEGYVVLTKKSGIVVTDSRYTVAAEEECAGNGFSVVEWKKEEYYKPLADVLREEKIQALGVEDTSMTVAAYHKLRDDLGEMELPEIEIKYLEKRVAEKRRVKTPEEIEKIRAAAAIGDRAFDRLLPVLREGMAEKEVAARLEFFMKEEGADAFSFETIAASGPNSAMPHAVPTGRRLAAGDFLTMDFGCVSGGYCSDMTRTVVIGTASPEQKKVYETVLSAQEAALSKIRPGMTGKEVDAVARNVISEAGYGEYFGHSLGHSVGLEIHEEPCFSQRDETVIEPGMVITVEPGIYIRGFGGVRIEDLIVVTENGCENLVRSDKSLVEIRKK